MYLSDDIQKALRSMQTILENEVLLKEGDLYIALNVESKQRRIVNIDRSLIESMQSKFKSDTRRILKG